ncbi:hypothetical protein [Janibacter sp. YB324]|uniref:AMIN-like domain-containing (lipo)protein n=1 Tax=Janibacter sp. YB324 TaxID=2761047 RepID=UPI001628B9A0|nr:hypothetical protein [Janibacter sp. YB324]QNF93221.1 hypothetical protein H7A72_10500 [Janibacter sp. YB324]
MTTTTSVRIGVGLTAAAAALLLTAPAAAPATSGSTACSTSWGSLAKANDRHYSLGTLTDVRSGRHACFDRLVVDVDRPRHSLSYDVRYVPTFREDGSGTVIPLRGGAKLQVVVRTPAYDDDFDPTYSPANRKELVDTTGYRTLRQVAWGGSWEGQSTMGIGTRARLPFKVTELDGPGDRSRLVIDVAHTW